MMDLASSKMSCRKIAALFACLFGVLSLSGCSTTTLQWPSLSIEQNEADDALSANEQSLLADLLSSKQKHHRDEAVREIENR